MIRLNDTVKSYREMASAKVVIESESKDIKRQLGRATKSLKTFKNRDDSLKNIRRERNEMKIQNKQLTEERDHAVARCLFLLLVCFLSLSHSPHTLVCESLHNMFMLIIYTISCFVADRFVQFVLAATCLSMCLLCVFRLDNQVQIYRKTASEKVEIESENKSTKKKFERVKIQNKHLLKIQQELEEERNLAFARCCV